MGYGFLQFPLPGCKIPVQPRYFVVLAVGVVIALLSAPKFVSGNQHGGTRRDEQRAEQISNRFQAILHQRDDLRTAIRTFADVSPRERNGRLEPVVPREIVVRAVPIIF